MSRVRGLVSGWFTTVPRAELTALVWHLRSATAPATYVGDCKEVVRGALAGLPETLTDSRSLHADLWRRVKDLIGERGGGLSYVKTKAHRSRAEAECSTDDPLENWLGNDAADSYAKDLCLRKSSEDQRWASACEMRAGTLPWLCHVGVASAWCFKHWPVAPRKMGRCHARVAFMSTRKAGKGISMRTGIDYVASQAHATH